MHECFRFGPTPPHPPALMAAWDRYSSSHYFYRENLPALDEMRDPKKLPSILADFGRQHGWTSAWGEGKRMHWTESWGWFSFSGDGKVRVLSVFAHVAREQDAKDAEKTIDHMIVREGFLRRSDPNDAEDLKRFPTPASVADEHQRKIELKDAAYPEPLRSLLQAKHTRGDSELKRYFAAIGSFRQQPDRKLLE